MGNRKIEYFGKCPCCNGKVWTLFIEMKMCSGCKLRGRALKKAWLQKSRELRKIDKEKYSDETG